MQPIISATSTNDCRPAKKGVPMYQSLTCNTFARCSLRLLGTNFGMRVLHLHGTLLHLKLADVQQHAIGMFCLAGSIRQLLQRFVHLGPCRDTGSLSQGDSIHSSEHIGCASLSCMQTHAPDVDSLRCWQSEYSERTRARVLRVPCSADALKVRTVGRHYMQPSASIYSPATHNHCTQSDRLRIARLTRPGLG